VKKSGIWLNGQIKWWTQEQYPDGLFAVSRSIGNQMVVTLVNFTDKDISVDSKLNYTLKSIEVEVGQAANFESSVIKLAPFSRVVANLEIG
jgi:hypothetical protein